MAKNINSISFTILLLVLLTASTGIQKSEAIDCGTPCTNPTPVFYGECGPVPYLGTNAQCCDCCKAKFGSPPICKAVVEGHVELHCHCYSN